MSEPPDPKDQRVTIMMSVVELEEIDARVHSERARSRGEFIRQLLREGLDRREGIERVFPALPEPRIVRVRTPQKVEIDGIIDSDGNVALGKLAAVLSDAKDLQSLKDDIVNRRAALDKLEAVVGAIAPTSHLK